MTAVPVVKVQDSNEPLLYKISAEVAPDEFGSAELVMLVEDLKQTKIAEEGVGIAAPQIGINKRVIVVGFEEGNSRYAGREPIPVMVLINPVLTPIGEDKEKGEEGCLSVPGVRALVPRYVRVRYVGFDADGKRIEGEASGFFARILQHECDHLDGRLFTSRVESDADYLKRPEARPAAGNAAESLRR